MKSMGAQRKEGFIPGTWCLEKGQTGEGFWGRGNATGSYRREDIGPPSLSIDDLGCT